MFAIGLESLFSFSGDSDKQGEGKSVESTERPTKKAIELVVIPTIFKSNNLARFGIELHHHG